MTVRIGDTVTAIHCASVAAKWIHQLASMSRSHGKHDAGKHYPGRDSLGDNTPYYYGNQSSWYDYHRNDLPGSYHNRNDSRF